MGVLKFLESAENLENGHPKRRPVVVVVCCCRAVDNLESRLRRQKRVTILAVLNHVFKIIHSKFAFFKSKVRFFGKFLMKFCRNFTNMLRINVKNFQFLEKKDPIFRKSVKISEMFQLFRKLFKIIQSCP